MKRITLTDGTGSWFDADKADVVKDETYYNGDGWVSKATGQRGHHETLYRTAGGVYVIHSYSEYSYSQDLITTVTLEEAAVWLSKQGLEPVNEDCRELYNNLQIL